MLTADPIVTAAVARARHKAEEELYEKSYGSRAQNWYTTKTVAGTSGNVTLSQTAQPATYYSAASLKNG